MGRLNNTFGNAKDFLITGIFAGIALVIANSWGNAITQTVTKLMTRIRCGKHNDSTKYRKCSKRSDLGTQYVAVLITTLFLVAIVVIIFLITGRKKPPSRK